MHRPMIWLFAQCRVVVRRGIRHLVIASRVYGGDGLRQAKMVSPEARGFNVTLSGVMP
ncbi:hypothetical protein JHU04_001849 [Brenneria sp. 4F2]|nr:hypothetical protein [Brenneria bubanii]